MFRYFKYSYIRSQSNMHFVLSRIPHDFLYFGIFLYKFFIFQGFALLLYIIAKTLAFQSAYNFLLQQMIAMIFIYGTSKHTKQIEKNLQRIDSNITYCRYLIVCLTLSYHQ